jgi:GNAT superfamily N-acetyltransferase
VCTQFSLDLVPVSVRECATPKEHRRSLEIYNTVWPSEAVTEEEVANWNASVRAHVDFLAAVDGAEVGSAVAAVAPTRANMCFALVTVLPEARRRGAGTALYAAVSEWAAGHDLTEIETRTAGDDDASIAFALHRGFREHSRETGLELDLRASALPPAEPPPGIEITTLAARPDAGPGVYDVSMEANPDVPGHEDFTPPPRESWLAHHLVEPQTPAEAIFLAVAGNEVVGYAKLRLDPTPGSATHAMTGVKRAWRRRGIASALKSAQIAWAKEQGLQRLVTTNELRNNAMLRVNERLGYRPVPGRVHLRGPLAKPV